MIGVDEDGEVEGDAVGVLVAVADEEEVALLVLQVLVGPVHVVGDVQERHVVVLFPGKEGQQKKGIKTFASIRT